MDSVDWGTIPAWGRRTLSRIGDAYHASGRYLGRLLLGVYPRKRSGERVLHNDALASNRYARSVRLSGSLPVLYFLGSDARSDVLPYRYLGWKEPTLFRNQILPVYAGRFGGDVTGGA